MTHPAADAEQPPDSAAASPALLHGTIESQEPARWWPPIVTGGLFIAAFGFDLITPLGISAWALYLPAVVTSMRLQARHGVVAATLLACGLTVLGYFLSPSGDVPVGATNRVLGVAALVLCGAICVRQRRTLGQFSAEQQKRLASEACFHSIFENAPHGKLIVDTNGTIVLANPAAVKIFGYDRDALIGQPVEMLVPVRFREVHVAYRATYQCNPSLRDMGGDRTVYGVHRDGHEMALEVRLSPVTIGPRVYICAAVVDVSQRHRGRQALAEHARQLAAQQLAALNVAHDAEQARRRAEWANAELKRSNQELDDFAYVASHDLKSPLRAIDNLSKWIVEDYRDALPEQAQNHLDTMQQRLHRMEQLLDDLLEYSRAGRTVMEADAVDTAALVNDVVETHCLPEGFTVRVAEDLPRLTTAAVPLKQVLMNLIGNAVKHHDRGEGRVEITCRDVGEMVEFAVSDDGPGIPRRFHERVFRMFQTLKPRDEVESSGVGLAIVKKVVERHGGRITVESGEGRGATFRFTWPKAGAKNQVLGEQNHDCRQDRAIAAG